MALVDADDEAGAGWLFARHCDGWDRSSSLGEFVGRALGDGGGRKRGKGSFSRRADYRKASDENWPLLGRFPCVRWGEIINVCGHVSSLPLHPSPPHSRSACAGLLLSFQCWLVRISTACICQQLMAGGSGRSACRLALVGREPCRSPLAQ